MAKVISSELTPDLCHRLGGEDLEASAEKVIVMVTVDPQGWPHPAMLGYGEIVATDSRNVRLATYTSSRTTANMRLNGKLTLIIVDVRAAYYIKGTVEELVTQMRGAPFNAKLNLRVEQVLADEADPQVEAGAYVARGIAVVDPNRGASLARARAVLAELRES